MPDKRIDVYLDFGKQLPWAHRIRRFQKLIYMHATASVFSYICFTDLEANRQKLAANGVTIE